MTFQLYDSQTRTVRALDPVRPGEVTIYHCGLTVQAAPHLGHIRKEVVFDVLRRWLEHQGLAVTVIANITDIDDKILARSAAVGVPWWAHAYTFERELHRAYALLGCQPPTYEPRATGHVPEMLELISTLIERGHAYIAADDSGDVYFDVASWPRYGELSGQRIEDMEAAADADPRGKRDPRDFALWKGHKPAEPDTASWSAPWGRGRPGWHIECSAMAGRYLGDEFDIHGGGLDLRFPHHENELAQSAAAGRGFARHWMHNAWVTMAGEKMSKSLGNGALVSEVTQRHPPRAVRFYLATPHYRSPIEFSEESLVEATAALARIDSFVERAQAVTPEVGPGALPAPFRAAMDDDLATPTALRAIYDAVRVGNLALEAGDRTAIEGHLAAVLAMLEVFGLRADDVAWQTTAPDSGRTDALVGMLVDQRAQARDRKDFAAADAIRDTLAMWGVTVTDTPEGARWIVEQSSTWRPEPSRPGPVDATTRT